MSNKPTAHLAPGQQFRLAPASFRLMSPSYRSVADMIDDIVGELHDEAEARHPHQRSYLIMKSVFQWLEMMLQRWVMKNQQYLQVIQHHPLGLFVDDEQRIIADEDVALLHEHNHFRKPPAAGALATSKGTGSIPAAHGLL